MYQHYSFDPDFVERNIGILLKEEYCQKMVKDALRYRYNFQKVREIELAGMIFAQYQW